MSPLSGVNPMSQLMQDVLEQARHHGGGHGGHGRIRQAGNAEDAEALEQSGQTRNRAFAQAIKDLEREQPPIEEARKDSEALADRRTDDQMQDGRQPGQQPDEQEPDAEDEAARVLAEWQAMNPGQP